jgi:sialate O-acetylesterase
MNASFATGAAVLALSSAAMAAVQLPAIISDNMVLQRSAKTPVWGQAEAGERVTVTFANVTADAVADPQGKWRVDLNLENAPKEPGDLVIAGATSITVRNAIVGEVWLCSGQSNMEWGLGATDDADEAIASANFPALRQFSVAKVVANEPQTALRGNWVVATPETAKNFTAVGYHFGREIHQKTGQPVGLIHSSWGGTDAESWTSDAQLQTVERYRESIQRRSTSLKEGALEKYNVDLKAWAAAHVPAVNEADVATRWAGPDVSTADWKTMKLPTMWQNAGLADNGIVWFRKEVDVPADAIGRQAVLSLGSVDDCDVTYVNGTQVGATGVETAQFWQHPRRYPLPAGLLKAGRNVIAVRVADIGGAGGMAGPAPEMRLTVGDQAIPLAGQWAYGVERIIDFSKLPPRPLEPMPMNPNQPAVLYNGMIAPLVPYALRGAIWYQGENNTSRHAHYAELMTLLIEGWRKDFARGPFPFYIVQLANFMDRAEQPTDTPWANLRDAQRQVTQTVPNTGLAVIIDIGEAKDIHPRNKRDVGKRLAAIALAKDYGQPIEYSGPLYDSHAVEGNKVRVRFTHATGLTADGGKPTGFAIAGDDGKFVWADATIDGDSVLLSAEGVAAPTAVRYAWANNPEVNLKNAAGLPAVPFKTK